MKEMLIHFEMDEVSIAICHEGQLMELYLPQAGKSRLLGSIYKGRVANVLPGMQAAFVDIGLEKNSFLYAGDVYSPPVLHGSFSKEAAEPAPPRRDIGSLLKEGQEVLVQIFKEARGDKGARVTMQPTLPGRYMVLLPASSYVAVSRRIEDGAERERLRALMKELAEGQGAIIRTAAAGISQEELASDFRSLNRQWKRIQGKAAKSAAPALLYWEQDALRRVIRDTVSADVECIVVESAEAAEKVQEIIKEEAAALSCAITVRAGSDIFAAYAVEEQLEKALRRKLWLKSGGYIVFDRTEALTVVDVNTGKFVGHANFGDTVLITNLEAATEIARQLRLRNVGGIIVIDFINMEQEQHRQALLSALEEELKKDRTRITLLGMTHLGLVELTRKKVGHELCDSLEQECPFCRGKGRVLSDRAAAQRLLQEIQCEAERSAAPTLQIMAASTVAAFLLGPEGRTLKQLQQRLGKQIRLIAEAGRRPEESVVRPVFEE